jgi:hypothetical protein
MVKLLLEDFSTIVSADYTTRKNRKAEPVDLPFSIAYKLKGVLNFLLSSTQKWQKHEGRPKQKHDVSVGNAYIGRNPLTIRHGK